MLVGLSGALFLLGGELFSRCLPLANLRAVFLVRTISIQNAFQFFFVNLSGLYQFVISLTGTYVCRTLNYCVLLVAQQRNWEETQYHVLLAFTHALLHKKYVPVKYN